MTIGSGVAVIGIWGTVAFVAMKCPQATLAIALFAMVSTIVIAGCSK